MKHLEIKLLHVSAFPNVRSRQSVQTDLPTLFRRIADGTFREPIDRLRLCLAGTEEQLAEAKRIKENLPCFVPVGICSSGHAVKHLIALSGALCVDLDHTDWRTKEVKNLIRRLPWVLGCFVSPSGCGVKVLVRVNPEDIRRDYDVLYAAVGKAVSTHVGHPYDEKCSILTQPCFCSHDEEAWFRPEAEMFVLVGTDEAVGDAGDKNEPEKETLVEKAWVEGTVKTASGFIAHFLERFERENPFVRGKRNDIALKLGRVAACSGFTPDELENLSKLFIRHYSNADFTAADIRQRIMAGYQYVMDGTQRRNRENRCQSGASVTYSTSPDVRVNNLLNDAKTDGEDGLLADNEEDLPEDIMARNNRLRAGTPLIPDEVYACLPDFLQRCIAPATNLRERDLLLLGSLNSCSALFPHVRFLYHRTSYSPHFYLAVVAPAGSGKGVLSYTASLLDATQDYYNEQRKQLRKAYEIKLVAWEEEQQKARREKRTPDVELKPEPPAYPYFKIPATTSKSRLIESLASAGEIGCCMVTTEMVTLSTAIAQDYGRFEDILLKAYHNEEVASSYKTDGDPIVARNPHLAVCLSGTQEQFTGFFHSLEVGLFSRFAIYTREQELQWESCQPLQGDTDVRQTFRQLGKELLAMHEGLLQFPTLVNFTPEQWARHTEHYTQLLRQNALEGREAVGGIIFRNGLLAMRLAAVFTVFRKWEDYRFAKAYTCTDADFRSALQVAYTLLEHGLLLSTSLPESHHKPVAMNNPHRMERVLSVLSIRFTFSEFVATAMGYDIPRSSAIRLLRKAIRMQLVEKEVDGYKKLPQALVEEVLSGTETEPAPETGGGRDENPS